MYFMAASPSRVLESLTILKNSPAPGATSDLASHSASVGSLGSTAPLGSHGVSKTREEWMISISRDRLCLQRVAVS